MINENNQEVEEKEVEEIDEIVEEKDEEGNDTTDWKALALKNQGIAKRYKTQMEKAKAEAEAKIKEREPNTKPEVKEKTQEELSPRDIIVLTNANIAEEEDIDVVLDYAKFKKISVAEALKSSVVKTTLAENEEHRRTAAAANTAPGRRGAQQKSEDSLLSEFKSGKVPETDDEMDRLALARMKARAGK
jgi:predicted nucleotide-binding protein (sugar kinase/HSP70/actin superfamily)